MGARADSRRQAVRFIVLLGVVSLLADITYEGARSITGPYLGMLGAGAAVVGAVAGAGELIGYALRLVSGYLADRTRSFWTLTLAGYAVNLLAVPALALAGRWEVAAAPLVFSRSLPAAAAGMVLWGVGMGSRESVLRAAVADMAPEGRRGLWRFPSAHNWRPSPFWC